MPDTLTLPAELQRGVAGERERPVRPGRTAGRTGRGGLRGSRCSRRSSRRPRRSIPGIPVAPTAPRAAAVDSSHLTNATSRHPGGCNVLFADGSVRFVKSSIDMRTWMQLGTIVGRRGHQLGFLLIRRERSAGAGGRGATRAPRTSGPRFRSPHPRRAGRLPRSRRGPERSHTGGASTARSTTAASGSSRTGSPREFGGRRPPGPVARVLSLTHSG